MIEYNLNEMENSREIIEAAISINNREGNNGYVKQQKIVDLTTGQFMSNLKPGTMGVYRVNNIDLVVSVPSNVNSSSGLVLLGAGSGGIYGTTETLNSIVKDQPNTIVVAPISQYENSYYAAHDTINLLKNNYNITSTPTYEAFSANTKTVLKVAAHAASTNPSQSLNVVIVDSATIDYAGRPKADTISDEELNSLIANNTTVINFNQVNDGGVYYDYAAKGLNVIMVEIKEQSGKGIHGAIMQAVQESDFYNISTGEYDFSKLPTTVKLEGVTYNLEYNFTERNGTTNRNISAQEASELVNKTSNLNTNNTQAITLSSEKLNALANLANVESDNDILTNSLNDIRNSIKNTKFLKTNLSNGGMSSTTKVPSEIPNAVMKFLQSNVALLELIAEETNQFAKIGTSIVNLDQNTSQETENLTDILTGTGTGLVTGASISSMKPTQNINQTTSQPSTSTTSVNNSNQTSSSNYQSSTQANTSSTNNYQSSTQNNNTSNNYQSTSSSNNQSTVSTPNTDQIIYNYNNEYQIIIHRNGDVVTGIEHYYDFGTREAANNAITTLLQKYQQDNYFDKLIQQDQYIKITFKEELYKNLTVTELQQKYSSLNTI